MENLILQQKKSKKTFPKIEESHLEEIKSLEIRGGEDV